MKALSIKQPWASLIAHGIKDIENRTWQTHFRGKIYIHVSAKLPKNHWDLLDPIQYKKAMDFIIDNDDPILPLGAIIGEVEIVDCTINHPSIWAEKTSSRAFADQKYYFDKPIYNWVLANPVLYEKPILNVKGKLSFWEPDIDIVECIGCSQKFDAEFMEVDESEEKFCTQCWTDLSPIMIKEAKECNVNGVFDVNDNFIDEFGNKIIE